MNAVYPMLLAGLLLSQTMHTQAMPVDEATGSSVSSWKDAMNQWLVANGLAKPDLSSKAGIIDAWHRYSEAKENVAEAQKAYKSKHGFFNRPKKYALTTPIKMPDGNINPGYLCIWGQFPNLASMSPANIPKINLTVQTSKTPNCLFTSGLDHEDIEKTGIVGDLQFEQGSTDLSPAIAIDGSISVEIYVNGIATSTITGAKPTFIFVAGTPGEKGPFTGTFALADGRSLALAPDAKAITAEEAAKGLFQGASPSPLAISSAGSPTITWTLADW